MNKLEVLELEIAMLEEQINEMQEELAGLKADRHELLTKSAEEDNPYWLPAGDDPYGGRYNKQILACKEALLAGNRAERFLANTLQEFKCKFVVTMADKLEDVSPEYMQMYSSEQTQQFAGAIVGTTARMGFLVDEINTPDGEIKGYLIPWAGNHGPVESRKKLEAYWASPMRMRLLRSQAERTMRWKDFQYKRAINTGTVDSFLRQFPYYEPPEE